MNQKKAGLIISSDTDKTKRLGKSYSVLMPVYFNENPDWFRASIQSVLDQTLAPDEFVLVCDGPLTSDLEAVIDWVQIAAADRLKVVRMATNVGLGVAINVGLQHASNDWIIRMDSDDIAYPDRCERQIDYALRGELDVASSWVEEFAVDPTLVTCMRTLPETHAEIIRLAHRRNPINHSCVLYRKSKVIAAGGYRHMPGFEDYDLWVRMLQAGAKMGNLQASLLYMRADSGLYRRRGGLRYCRDMARFWFAVRKLGFVSTLQCWTNIIPRSIVSLVPNTWRQRIYQKRLRST